MYQIQKTKNYKLFKKLPGNREVTRSALNNLIDSIKKDNQLNMHPIIVDKNMVVIDGQHRLRAAEDLGLEVYYVQSDKISHYHFIDGNLNQKKLSMTDYIKFFAETEKKEDYIKLHRWIAASGTSARAFLVMLLGSVSTCTLEFLKTGKFEFPEDNAFERIFDNYMHLYSYVQDKKIKPYGMFKGSDFCKAFRWLNLTQGFSYETFLSKLDNRWFDLKPQASAENWYTLLIDIYNWRNVKKIEAEFLDEKISK